MRAGSGPALGMLLSKTKSHRNERDPEAVQVWDFMVKGRLIRIVWSYIYKQDASSFSVAHSIRTPKLSVLDLEQFWDG